MKRILLAALAAAAALAQADTTISGLPAATVPLGGTELSVIVQGGATKKLTLTPANIGAPRLSAAHATVLTVGAPTNVTLPTAGTLSTLAGTEALTNKTYNGNTWTPGTGVLTIGAGKTLATTNTLSLTGTDGSTLNVGTGGTLGTAAYTNASAYVAPSAYASSNGLTMVTGKLLGRTTAASGPAEEITLGTGLSMAGGTLSAAVGAGSVTSVTLTGDGTLLSSTPTTAVTTSGTLAATLLTHSANTVLAGPTSGGATTPTFRALVGADLPNPSASTLGGVQSITNASSKWISYIDTSGVPHQSQPTYADLSTGVPTATASVLGLVKPDGTTLTNTAGAVSVTYGTSAATAAQGNDSRITGAAQLATADQTLSGGANLTAFNIGTASSGTKTIDCGKNPAQYMVNGGAFTFAAPIADGNCLVLVTNNGSAGAITFSGFSVPAATGDALTTTNAQSFTISVWRINSVSGYRIAAMQ